MTLDNAAAFDNHALQPMPRRLTLDLCGLTVARLSYDRDDLDVMPPNARTDAFSTIIQLQDFRLHRLWREDRLVFEGGHAKGAIAITDLRDEWRCHHLSPFDNVRFAIPFSRLREFAEEAARPEFSRLHCKPGGQDPVVLGLAQALLPALDDPRSASRLFLDQISLALLTHLTQTYGGVHFPARRVGTLAAWQEKRAIDFLVAHLNGEFSLEELARECGLSKSYFNKAFKESFAKTPYRWLIEYRIVQARQMLMTPMPIAEVAVACGFSDQSHLTRVFSEIVGQSPRTWRKLNRRP